MSYNAQEELDEAFKPMTVGFRLEGMQGNMVAHVGHAFENGRHCALVALVCSEAYPEGLLEGAVFHWAVASREGGTWSPPPDSWQSDPSHTSAVGTHPVISIYVHSECLAPSLTLLERSDLHPA